MKNLGQFFDVERFLAGKKLVVTDNQVCVDYDTKAEIGRTIEVGIMEDKTVYHPSAKGNVSDNLLEKFKVKVINNGKGNIDQLVDIKGVQVVFSDFRKADLYVDTNGRIPVLAMSLECYSCTPVKKDK